MVAGELGLESGILSPPALYYLGRRFGAELEVVSVEAQLSDQPSMRRCLPMRLGQMLEGHSHPRRSWLGDEKLGFRPGAVVSADTRVLTVSERIYVPSLP